MFDTGEYKLFSIITENVRMDLNYLLALNPDFDILGFPALRRNLRISIEAYYDLYNLTSDRSYMNLLRCQSIQNSNIDDETVNIYKPFLKSRIFKINTYPLTIKEKANIAKDKNHLHPDIFNQLKDFATDSNSYIHPDIFVTCDNNRDGLLKSLIFCDCRLIMYAFDLLNNFIKFQNAPYISTVNPYVAYHRLYDAIAPFYWIYR